MGRIEEEEVTELFSMTSKKNPMLLGSKVTREETGTMSWWKKSKLRTLYEKKIEKNSLKGNKRINQKMLKTAHQADSTRRR